MEKGKTSQKKLKENPTYIEITNLHVSDNKILVKLNFSEDIGKYFLMDYFVADYDEKIENVDNSILSIPALSTVITIAWAAGADVYMECLDKTYLDALGKVEAIFRDWFPQFSFSTKIHVRNIISNESNNKRYAMLFSGGLDSLTSYIRNREKRPTLISIWGVDNPSPEYKNYKFWNKVRNKLLSFANQEGVDIHFIKTNTGELINGKLLAKEYDIEEEWWGEVSHGLVLTGLSAPIIAEEVGTIFVASTHTKDFLKPWGSNPKIDNNISWADVKVIHDGYELSRMEKIEIIKNNPECLPYLSVCNTYREHNCGFCEKCWRTITGLVLEDVDPKKCNFDIKKGIFSLIKAYFKNGWLNLGYDQIFFWQDIQRHIPDNLDEDKLYNSRDFFEWFKKFDLSKYKYQGGNRARFLRLYYLTKYSPIYAFRLIIRYILTKFKNTKRLI